jgi:hypothetical protein
VTLHKKDNTFRVLPFLHLRGKAKVQRGRLCLFSALKILSCLWLRLAQTQNLSRTHIQIECWAETGRNRSVEFYATLFYFLAGNAIRTRDLILGKDSLYHWAIPANLKKLMISLEAKLQLWRSLRHQSQTSAQSLSKNSFLAPVTFLLLGKVVHLPFYSEAAARRLRPSSRCA